MYLRGQRKPLAYPPKECAPLENECQDSSLSEEDVEGAVEDFSHCPDTVDLEGMFIADIFDVATYQ